MYQWKLAKIKPGINEYTNPQRCPNHVVSNKFTVRHRADSRDEWCKSPDDRDKARDDDGFSAVFKIEGMGFIQIFLFQETESA